MKLFQLIGTHSRVLLVNQRASTVFILTSRRTKIAKYASEPRLRGLLAEHALAQPYLEQKVLVT